MASEHRTSQLFRDEAGELAERDRLRVQVHWLVDNAGGRVLDVGCSQGITSILCARAGHRVLGIDSSPDRIADALADRDAKPPPVRERLEFRVGDPTALDLPDGAFDTVLLGDLIATVPDPGPVLREAARVVAPGGVVLVTVPLGYRPEPGWRPFYVGSLVGTLAPHLSIRALDIAEGHLRAQASPGEMPAEAAVELTVKVQERFEEALSERAAADWRERRRLIRDARRERRTLRRALNRERRHARRLARRVSSFRRSRWSRLGRALAGARTASGALRLPAEVVKALRQLPPAPLLTDAPLTEPEPAEPRTLVVSADAVAGTDDELSVEIPEAHALPPGPVTRPELRVATILDPFSSAAFRYEWDQIEVGPEDWREALGAARPDLLFVESAWRGNGDRWAQAVVGAGPFAGSFAELVGWCRAQGIPTVFWNKEDPPRFNTFLPAARLFDWIFTTDSNRVGSYQEAIGNEQVSVLMFGAQPRVHNPVAPEGGRRYPVAFAGTYLGHKHPHRRAQMEMLLDPARDFGLHIFTRVPPGERDRFDWPEKYRSHIVGSLPYERMVTAFKAYRLVLNVNTVVASPTMCARRAFEISATATPVLSADAHALREVFGELVAIASSADDAREHLEHLLGNPEVAARRGHAAMRHVMRGHTYRQRVDEVLRAVGLEQHLSPEPPSISVVVPLADGEAPQGLLEQLAKQTRPAREVIVAALPAAADRAEGELLAAVDPGCDYSEHFLEDLAAAFDYTDAVVVGKSRSDGSAHSYTLDLHPEALLARTTVIRELGFGSSGGDPVAGFLEACRGRGLRGYAADPYSFERRPLRSIGI